MSYSIWYMYIGHELALLYNDESVLENHHLYVTFSKLNVSFTHTYISLLVHKCIYVLYVCNITTVDVFLLAVATTLKLSC